MSSHLTRGAWIEIFLEIFMDGYIKSRTSHEVRGLKLHRRAERLNGNGCRTSHEVRGLKYLASLNYTDITVVAPHTRCVD